MRFIVNAALPHELFSLYLSPVCKADHATQHRQQLTSINLWQRTTCLYYVGTSQLLCDLSTRTPPSWM